MMQLHSLDGTADALTERNRHRIDDQAGASQPSLDGWGEGPARAGTAPRGDIAGPEWLARCWDLKMTCRDECPACRWEERSGPPPAASTEGEVHGSDSRPRDVLKPTVSSSGPCESPPAAIRSLDGTRSAWSRWTIPSHGDAWTSMTRSARTAAWKRITPDGAPRSGHQPPDRLEQNERLPRRWVRNTKRAGSGGPGCRRYRR